MHVQDGYRTCSLYAQHNYWLYFTTLDSHILPLLVFIRHATVQHRDQGKILQHTLAFTISIDSQQVYMVVRMQRRHFVPTVQPAIRMQRSWQFGSGLLSSVAQLISHLLRAGGTETSQVSETGRPVNPKKWKMVARHINTNKGSSTPNVPKVYFLGPKIFAFLGFAW
jgi:hypothetical protein